MTIPTPFLQVVVAGAASWAVALLVTPLVRWLAVAVGCVARPSHDRWGRRAIARLGGLPIAAAFLVAAGWGAWQDPRLLGLFLAGCLMLLTGLVDDCRTIHPYSKLIAQIVAGCLVVLAQVRVEVPLLPWVAIPLTIGWLVLVMNAFNLMDNMDGLSAGIGVIAAGICAWHAVQTGQWLMAKVLASLLGATAGFLRYNLPPAKIYMGDTGSQVLGLGLGSLALMGAMGHSSHLLGILALPTLLLAVPIFDTCFVTLQRLVHGRHPFQGGTDHLSHRLGVLGLSTRQIVFVLYGLSAAFGVASVALTGQHPLVIIGVWLLAVGVCVLAGAYLARVRVYTGPAPVPMGPRSTVIETMLLHKRRLLEVCVDFALICASYVMAHALRFEGSISADLQALILQSLPWVIAIKMAAFFGGGLYRGVWRYTSVADLVTIFRAVVLGSACSALILLYLWRFQGYSRAVFIIDGLLLFVLVGGARVMERVLNEWIRATVPGAIPTLVVGAGDGGELFLRCCRQGTVGLRRVVGFLDDDPAKRWARIHGVPVLGSRGDLGRIVQAFGVRVIVVAMRHPPRELLQQIQGYCEENGLTWQHHQAAVSDASAAISGE